MRDQKRTIRDTSEEMRTRYRDMIMALTPEQRLVMCTRMWADARALVIAVLADAPNPEGHSLRARIFLRMYGRDFEPAERERIVAALNLYDRSQPAG
jgi:hypothetical protein